MRRIIHALGALIALLALLIGLPVLLVRLAGQPLPTKIPDWGHIATMLQQADVPAAPVIKTLAVVLWVLWLAIVWSLLWELITFRRSTSGGRRHVPAPLVPAPVSVGIGRLVAAIFAIGLITAHSTTSLAAGLPRPSTVAVVTPPAAVAAAATQPATARPTVRGAPLWVTGSNDTLWDIAESALGDGTRVDEILELNPGLRTARHLRAGRVVQFPADAHIPASRRPAALTAGTATGSSTAAPTDLDSDTSKATTIVVDTATYNLLPDGMGPIVVTTVADPTAPPDTAAADGDEHMIVAGDTLWDLIDDHYGRVDAHLVNQVAAALQISNPDNIPIGTRIVFPDQATLDPPSGAPAEAPDAHGAVVYTVVKGDSLWRIVERHYGYADTALVNRAAVRSGIDHPDLIFPGQQVVLPDADGDAGPALDPAPNVAPTDTAETPSPTDLGADAAAPAPAAPVDAPQTSVGDPPAATVSPSANEQPTPSTTTVATPPPPAAPGLSLPPPTVSTPSSTSLPTALAGVGEVDVGDEGLFDLSVRSVWWDVVGGSLLTAGILIMVRRLRGRRMQQVEPGERVVIPPAMVAGTELAIDATRPRERIATLQGLLRTVTPHARELREPPPVRAVEFDTDRVEVLFVDPAPFPPAGWTTADGGRSWVHRLTGDETPPAVTQLVTPALVTVGTRHGGGQVLLDVETAGSVGLAGDRNAALALARSMVLELATYPLGVPMDVCLVGIDVDGVEHCDRMWPNTSMVRAVRVAREVLDRTASLDEASLIAARAATDEDHGLLDPQVFVVDRDCLDDHDETMLDELLRLCQPQAGAAVIVIGGHRNVAETIDVAAEGSATWAGATLQAPQVSREAVAQVAVMLEHAAQAATEPCTPTAVVAQLLADPDPDPDPDHDTHDGDGGGVEGDDGDDDVEYIEPSYDVLVRVLGEVRVDGATITAASDIELLTLLVCLRDRAPNIDAVITMMGNKEIRTIQNRVGSLRTRLGAGRDGKEMIPRAQKGPRTGCVYLVSERVLTDIDLIEHRYQTSLQLPSSAALQVLRDGLVLFTGPAFRARHGYDWAWPEGVLARVFNLVNAYAARLMELAFDAGDLELVLDTIRHAGSVMTDPIVEAPMRRLEREYADATGDPDLLASATEARRRLLTHINDQDTLAEQY